MQGNSEHPPRDPRRRDEGRSCGTGVEMGEKCLYWQTLRWPPGIQSYSQIAVSKRVLTRGTLVFTLDGSRSRWRLFERLLPDQLLEPGVLFVELLQVMVGIPSDISDGNPGIFGL